MGVFQRICTLEALCVGGFVGFFLGTFIGYFAMFYNGCAGAGHGGGRNCHTIRARLHSDASTGGHGEGIDMVIYTYLFSAWGAYKSYSIACTYTIISLESDTHPRPGPGIAREVYILNFSLRKATIEKQLAIRNPFQKEDLTLYRVNKAVNWPIVLRNPSILGE